MQRLASVLFNAVCALTTGKRRNNESRTKDGLYKVSILGEREREREREVGGGGDINYYSVGMGSRIPPL